MKNLRKIARIAVLTFTTMVVPALAHANVATPHADVIYGDDNRADLYQVTDPTWKAIAESTVALFQSRRVVVNGSTATLMTSPLGERMNLCSTEPFYNQGSGAFCSGSLVGPDLVMTAGHCVNQQTCGDTKFVFGFSLQNQSDTTVTTVPATEVYRCAQVVSQQLRNDGLDYAVVRLDRRVMNHAPLAVNRQNNVSRGTQLVMIGHPSGLPLKVAGGAYARDVSNPYYFSANTDSYGGNSGSAVFNAQTGLIEGILVRGEDDYEPDYQNGCTRSKHCDMEGCRGEDITKVVHPAAYIPQ